MHSFSVISKNVTINHILLKTRFFGLHFCHRQVGSSINHFDVIGRKADKLAEIMQNIGY